MDWIKIDGSEDKPIDKDIILRYKSTDMNEGIYLNGWYNEDDGNYNINDQPHIDQELLTHYIILQEPVD